MTELIHYTDSVYQPALHERDMQYNSTLSFSQYPSLPPSSIYPPSLPLTYVI